MVKRISFAFRTDSLAQRISDECVLTNDCLVNGVTLDWIAWRGVEQTREGERGEAVYSSSSLTSSENHPIVCRKILQIQLILRLWTFLRSFQFYFFYSKTDTFKVSNFFHFVIMVINLCKLMSVMSCVWFISG